MGFPRSGAVVFRFCSSSPRRRAAASRLGLRQGGLGLSCGNGEGMRVLREGGGEGGLVRVTGWRDRVDIGMGVLEGL